MTFADISQIGDDLIHTINQSLYHHSSVQRDEASIQNYPVIQLLDYLNDKKTLQRNDAVIGIIKSLHSLESNGMPKSCMDEVKGALKYQGLVNESFIESARRLANQAEPLEHNVDDERRKQVCYVVFDIEINNKWRYFAKSCQHCTNRILDLQLLIEIT